MLMTSKNFFNGKIQAHKKRFDEIKGALNTIGFSSPDVMNLEKDIIKYISLSRSFLNMGGYMDNELRANDEKISGLISQLEQVLNTAQMMHAKSQCVQK